MPESPRRPCSHVDHKQAGARHTPRFRVGRPVLWTFSVAICLTLAAAAHGLLPPTARSEEANNIVQHSSPNAPRRAVLARLMPIRGSAAVPTMTCRVDAARYGSPIGLVCSAMVPAGARLTSMRVVLPNGTSGVFDFASSATGRYAQPSRRVVTWTAHRPVVMRTRGRAVFRFSGVILPRAMNTLTATLYNGRKVVAAGESRVFSRLGPVQSRRWRAAAMNALREYESAARVMARAPSATPLPPPPTPTCTDGRTDAL